MVISTETEVKSKATHLVLTLAPSEELHQLIAVNLQFHPYCQEVTRSSGFVRTMLWFRPSPKKWEENLRTSVHPSCRRLRFPTHCWPDLLPPAGLANKQAGIKSYPAPHIDVSVKLSTPQSQAGGNIISVLQEPKTQPSS